MHDFALPKNEQFRVVANKDKKVSETTGESYTYACNMYIHAQCLEPRINMLTLLHRHIKKHNPIWPVPLKKRFHVLLSATWVLQLYKEGGGEKSIEISEPTSDLLSNLAKTH